MAFLKKAYAAVTHPNWGPQNWVRFMEEHQREMVGRGPYRTASGSPNLVAQASEILKQDFDPKNFLLTHATIVASVDTDDVSNVRLGAVSELGHNVNRKWANFRVRPACDIYINNNHDCWDRPVLLKSYRTFVGAFNFCEHVQIEEQSKGRIIDAAARDIGDSVYIDILIATDRRHSSLIRDIESGRMSTLSMGCSVTETQCTKCGNVAADETEMCEHVRYAKGNYEFDAQGRKYRIAELCGHDSLDPTGGVTFIEASWVAVPAFTGAAVRNILDPGQINPATHERARAVLASPPPEWTRTPDGDFQKAARFESSTLARPVDVSDDDELRRVAQFPPMPGAAPGGEPPAPEEKDPISELEEKLEKSILDRVKKRIEKKLRQDEDEEDDAEGSSAELATSTNENINHQAARQRQAALISGADTLVRIARSDVELIDGLARLNQSYGVQISRDIYRAVLRVGSTDGQPSLERYLHSCVEVLGRKPTTGEAKTMIRLGRILSLRKKTRF
jgi:hypothetical protein